MIKEIVISVILWWAFVVGIFLAADSRAHGQAAPAPEGIASCQDVLSVEAEAWMEGGWTPAKRQEIEGGGAIYIWTKGQSARALLFAPEAAGKPPKGSVFRYLGRCGYKGETRLISVGLLEGEKA